MTRATTAVVLLVCLVCLGGCGRYGPPERRPAPITPPVSAAGSAPVDAEPCEDPESKAEAAAEIPE